MKQKHDKCSIKNITKDIALKDTLKPTKTIAKTSNKKSTCCNVCRKRVGFLGFDCKCGKLFCGTHRYFDKHDCTFDYSRPDKEQLVKDNPIIKAEKLVDRI